MSATAILAAIERGYLRALAASEERRILKMLSEIAPRTEHEIAGRPAPHSVRVETYHLLSLEQRGFAKIAGWVRNGNRRWLRTPEGTAAIKEARQ